MPRPPLLRWIRSAACATVAGLTIFCTPASPQTPAPVPHLEARACVVRPDSAATRPGDTLRLVVNDSVRPGASAVAGNSAERFIARQMYETLVRIDCDGNLAPAVASQWATDDSGLTWTFTLRENLHWWDGAPFTAGEVVRALGGRGSDSIQSVDSIEARTVRIIFATRIAVPFLLADPALAFQGHRLPGPSSGWPMGTGPYRPDSTALVTMTRLIPADTIGSLPILEFWQVSGGDLRDLLDRGADVMLTTNPSLIDYADRRGDRSTLPLSWAETYWLHYYPPVDSLPAVLAPLADSARGEELRRSLSRDAVRAETRPAAGGRTRVSSCDSFEGPCPRRFGLILYPPSDRTARDLAERLVALVPGRLHWNAVPSDDKRASRGAIGSIATAPIGQLPAGSGSAIPLVDARTHAIIKRGTAPWVVDGDGILRMPRPGTLPQ